MATYKEVHGTNIQVLSSDPSVTTNGQIWYNSTSGTLKGFANKVNGSWVSGGSMNTARTSLGSANAGTQTAALGFGANTYGNPGITESYNGSTWTDTGDLNNKKELIKICGHYVFSDERFKKIKPNIDDKIINVIKNKLKGLI